MSSLSIVKNSMVLPPAAWARRSGKVLALLLSSCPADQDKMDADLDWGSEDEPVAQAVQAAQPDTAQKPLTPMEAEVRPRQECGSDRTVDQQLVERVQHGDPRAYEQLVVKYERKIQRMLARMVRDAAEVEDITQEAFIKAYRALPQFRGESAFYTWLYRIAINSARNHLVAQGRRKVPMTTELNSDEAGTGVLDESLRDNNTPESELMSKQVAHTVNSALEQLPEDLRTAITLREMEGLSYDEIAEIMKCPVGTVRSRIFRAREAIAQRLRPLLGTSKEKRW